MVIFCDFHERVCSSTGEYHICRILSWHSLTFTACSKHCLMQPCAKISSVSIYLGWTITQCFSKRCTVAGNSETKQYKYVKVHVVKVQQKTQECFFQFFSSWQMSGISLRYDCVTGYQLPGKRIAASWNNQYVFVDYQPNVQHLTHRANIYTHILLEYNSSTVHQEKCCPNQHLSKWSCLIFSDVQFNRFEVRFLMRDFDHVTSCGC